MPLPYLLPLLLLLPNPNPNLAAANSSEAAALLSFKSAADPSGRLLPFPSSLPHCLWPGITCSPHTHLITRLLLQNLSLNGTFPNSGLPSLHQLRILSLKSNALRGPIPNLSSLPNLKSLFLSHNLFSGPFPSSLLSLHSLRTLDLSHNLLSGEIPAGLASLERLNTLRLESNRFSGRIPALNISSLRVFDVSSNDLFGPVPVTATFSSFGPAAFEGNPRLCGALVLRECGPSSNFFYFRAAAPSPARIRVSTALANRKKHEKSLMVIGILVLGVVLGMVIVGVGLVVREKKKKNGKEVVFDEKEERSAEEVEESCNEVEEKMRRMGRSGSLVFCAGEKGDYGLEQLMRASAEMLGRGSLGSTYKAVLDERLVLCVKRLDGRIGLGGREGFERHVEVVGRLRHPNLVALRAFFQGREERLLVYDYQPNGSLHSLIHGMISCSLMYFLLRNSLTLRVDKGLDMLISYV